MQYKYDRELEAKSTNIKKWYLENYSDDNLGEELKDNITFYDLFDALDNYQDVYDFIGVGDSLIRERLFEKLSKIMECDYDEVYNQWMPK